MSYPAKAVANYFVRRGLQDHNPVDPMKLQKLIYFAHGWHLAVYDEPLIDEMIEAWRYGPVTPSIYHGVKSHGSSPIDFPIFQERATGRIPPSVVDEGPIGLLDRVWGVYGGISSVRLSDMSHDPNGPWSSTWRDGAYSEAIKGVDIPNEAIKEYFLSIAGRHRDETA